LLFVADDKEARFAQLADELADGLPAEYASERIYLGDIAGGGARPDGPRTHRVRVRRGRWR